MQGDPMDLLALIPLLVLLAYGLRQSKREARRGVGRPGLVSDPEKDKTLYTLSDREGEALPPFLAGFCRPCAEGVCDRAEHLGLTDADVPGGER